MARTHDADFPDGKDAGRKFGVTKKGNRSLLTFLSERKSPLHLCDERCLDGPSKKNDLPSGRSFSLVHRSAHEGFVDRILSSNSG